MLIIIKSISMFNTFKGKLTGDKKIQILLLVLFIFNIILYINFFSYLIDTNQVNINVLEDFVTINSTIIILGFISTRLPKLKEKTDGSFYEIGYFILLGLLSLTISYFNSSTHGQSFWAPFVRMFRLLSVLLIVIYISTKFKSFKAIVRGDYSRKTIIWQIIICSILGILASYLTFDVRGVPANSRGLIVMISALLGGPYVGIPVGLISGIWRYGMGGPTAFACFVGTVLAGVIGSLVHKWNGGIFLRPYKAAILMFVYTGFDMFLVSALTPPPEGILIADTLYGPMTFASVMGMVLFTLFLAEKKDEIKRDEELKQIEDNTAKISDNSDIIDLNTDRIIEMSRELKEYKNKVDELEKKLKGD